MSKTPVCVVEAACWSNAVALRLNADVFRLVLSLLMLAAVAVAAGASVLILHTTRLCLSVCVGVSATAVLMNEWSTERETCIHAVYIRLSSRPAR